MYLLLDVCVPALEAVLARLARGSYVVVSANE